MRERVREESQREREREREGYRERERERYRERQLVKHSASICRKLSDRVRIRGRVSSLWLKS
jgi:hypothetical protein